ncbi:MAG: hypothetical protein KC731_12490 [Myxococcales bacterium]|nr:hypothetical protein [Myxococcales bacterium]
MTRSAAGALLALWVLGCGGGEGPPGEVPDAGAVTAEERAALEKLVIDETPVPDVTNAWADDPAAAALGQALFFDPRFSGPLLDSDNNGFGAVLGAAGETGKVSCAGCHVPESGFLDSRSSRKQVSLGAGWTDRRAPSLLDVGQRALLMWDGRRDAAFNQVFSPLESPFEMNSSRLFAAQQMEALYRDDYEAIFGPFPDLSGFAPLAAADAGCSELPERGLHCDKDYDDAVTRVVVDMGKAISAFLRRVDCGPSRFDAWMEGEDAALSEEEIAGARLFVGKGQCVQCHQGPTLSDGGFHNLGLPAAMVSNVVAVGNDPGAAEGLAAMLTDPLNSRGMFSDGDDGRLDRFDGVSLDPYLGAFRTPSLRCVAGRPSFTHTGQIRTLEDIVHFKNQGGGSGDFLGENELLPLGLSDEEEAQLVAFLKALDGAGPDAALLSPP